MIQPSAALLFFVAVMISTWYGGFGPGLLATAFSALAIDYFFMPPAHSMSVGLDDILELVVFMLIALLISSLSKRRRLLEAELQRRVEELAEADRRKDEFLATLAHELRNPLAPILSALELMRLRTADDPTLKGLMDAVERQTWHLARLVDDLLEVSRITRGKVRLRKEPLDLETVVARAVETSRPFIEARKHELSVSPPGEPVRLEADPIRLEQVLINLLNNAAKYTDPGGRIWLTWAREGGEAVVRVRDTGIGIPPEMLSRIFDLFTQVDRSLDRAQGGLGIGLTLVRNLIEMHGGAVSADSAGPGRGSEFVVRLPALPPGPEPEAAESEPVTTKPKARGSGRRVLVVDDNVDAATTLGELLRLWGHKVWVAYDGPGAIQETLAHQPEVVLLDIGLPEMDGYEVARRLQQIGPEKPMLIALTGYGQEEDQCQSEKAGFAHHFTKPINLVTLQQVLSAGVRV